MAYIADVVESPETVFGGSVSPFLGERYQADDLLLVFTLVDTNTTPTVSAGWTQVITQPGAMGGSNLTVFRKIAASSSETITITTGATTSLNTILTIKGVDTSAPIDASAINADNTNKTSEDCPTVTTLANDSLVLRAGYSPSTDTAYFANLSTVEEISYQAGLSGFLSVGAQVVSTAGAAGTQAIQRGNTANDPLGGVTIAINDAVSSFIQPTRPQPWNFIFRFKDYDDEHDPKTWNLDLSALITTFNSATVKTVTAIEGVGNVNASTERSNGYSFNFAGAATGLWQGVYISVSLDLSGQFLYYTSTAGQRSIVDPIGIPVILFTDASNYAAWFNPLREYEAANGAIASYVQVDSAPDLEVGTFDSTNVTSIGFAWLRTGGSTTRGFNVANCAYTDSIPILGGISSQKLNYRDFFLQANQLSFLNIVNFRGTGQAQCLIPLSIGDATQTTQLMLTGSSYELPVSRLRQNQWDVDPSAHTTTIDASASDVIDYSGSILATSTLQNFTIAPTSSTSATYNFSSTTIIGFTVTMQDNIPFHGTNFRDCAKIDGKGATLTSCAISQSIATDAAITLTDGAEVSDSTFTKGAETYAIEITEAGSYDLSGTTYSGYTTELNITALSGTVTITLLATDLEPDFDTAGATVTFVQPPATYTIQFPNIIDDSRYQIYNVTTDTELDNALVSGGSGISEAYTSGTNYTPGDTGRYRITYTSGASAKIAIEGSFTFSGGTVTNSIPISQDDDLVYNAAAIDGSGVTEFSWDSGNIEVDINDADNTTTVQRLAAWYSYFITTATGIEEAFGGITWISVNEIRINQATVDVLLDNTKATPLQLVGGRLFRADGSVIIASGSNSIQVDYSPVYIVETGVSGLTTAESNLLNGIGSISSDVFTEEVEGGYTFAELLKLYNAILLSKVSGGGTATETFRDIADTKNRVVATVDASGNRTAITLDET